MKPKFYHWILLIVCALFALIEGVLDATGGASSSSPSYKVDDIVVRLLGVGLVIFSALIFMRMNWAFFGLILFFFVSSVEVVATYRFTSQANQRLPELLLVAAGVLMFFGIPMALLIWLRFVFVGSQKALQRPATPPGR